MGNHNSTELQNSCNAAANSYTIAHSCWSLEHHMGLRMTKQSTSTDSDTSNTILDDNKNCRSTSADDSVILNGRLNAADQKKPPMKIRKVSRAASMGTNQPKRSIPGLRAFKSKTDVMSNEFKTLVIRSWQTVLEKHNGDTALVGLSIYQVCTVFYISLTLCIRVREQKIQYYGQNRPFSLKLYGIPSN
ncbi:hypothetical protein AB6A40_010350 [Gnathostoma spinigerum]|uniref:Uncharacterized protein n=1 Tax=Gnathostoma spinigerum TaxID=75299 RepID=A0ABD6EWB1_9BILA